MILAAHYFLQHTYTYHRKHMREDFAWIADTGASRVVLSILEQDLFAIDANLDCLCEEAQRAGLEVLAIPSRWGGLVAGAPKAPSLKACARPDTWMLKPDGSPELTAFGPIMSVHHPDTMELFVSSLERLLGRWPFAGLVWDEPKALEREDHSPMAKERRPADAALAWHTQTMADFFDAVGAAVRKLRPEAFLGMFIHGQLKGQPIESCARIQSLDAFGLDARPWSLRRDQPKDDGAESVRSLLDDAPRFFEAARRQGKQTLMLVENHCMPHPEDIDLMDRRLPEILQLDADHVHFYYRPRNVCEPDRQMDILARHLRRAAS